MVDIYYGGENGFNQAIELAAESLANVKFIQEKKLIGWLYEPLKVDEFNCFFLSLFSRPLFRRDQPRYGQVLFWCGGHAQGP